MMISPLIYIFAPIFFGIIIYLFKLDWMRYIVIPLQLILLISSFIGFIQIGDNYLTLALSAYPRPITMSLHLDSFSYLMILLNNILFFACTFFDLDEDYNKPLFIFLFISLQGLINGIFLSDDLFNIYIMIELASIIVAVLIMFKKDASAMYNGMFYLMVNIFAMSFYLLGLGFIYKHFGVLDFNSIAELLPRVKDPVSLIVPFAFLITGVSIKASLLPVFSWLPKAHATPSAPAVVSAILSGVYVKVGLYLLIRLLSLFEAYLNINNFLVYAGLLTAIIAIFLAFSHNDIKLILAYHTISQIGIIISAYGFNTEISRVGAVYHIFTHGIFKALLFLLASEMIAIYQTRDIRKMRGLWRESKRVSVLLIIAILSISAAPFMAGGMSKFVIIEGVQQTQAVWFYHLISIATLLSFIKFGLTLFSQSINSYPRKLANSEWLALYALATLCILLGWQINPIFRAITRNIELNFFNYLLQIVVYLLLIGLALLAYKLLYQRKFWHILRKIDISFNDAILSVVLYFIFILNYLYMTIDKF